MWNNRIVGYGSEDPEQLLANPSNWRIHPAFQQEALQGALEEIGWLSEVIVNKRTGEEWGAEQGVETVLDGHLRVRLALREGQAAVPVKYVDLTPDEEALALATFDPLSALAVADAEILGGLLAQIDTEHEALGRLLADLADLAGGEAGKTRDLPDGEAGAGGTVTFRVTVPDAIAGEAMAVFDTLKAKGLKWERVEK